VYGRGRNFSKEYTEKMQVCSPRLLYNPSIKRNILRIVFNPIKRDHKKIFIKH